LISASTSLTCSCFCDARGGRAGEEFGLGHQVDAILQPAKADAQRGGGNAKFLVAGLEIQQRIK
jgi:hypothetical protein